MIAFRMGADDARSMQKYFEPKFEEYDLVHMNNRNFVINMTIDGEKTPAFSATTLDLPAQQFDQTANIIEHSRSQYAIDRSSSEAYIHRNYEVEAGQRALAKQAETTERKPEGPPKVRAKSADSKSAPQSAQPVVGHDAAAKNPSPATPAADPATVGHAAVGSVVERVKLKRRRKRNKKKKPAPKIADTTETTERTIFER